jgi:predicted NAD/FAD-dependent oxidoreductase/deoxyribodipyrimidine photolyase
MPQRVPIIPQKDPLEGILKMRTRREFEGKGGNRRGVIYWMQSALRADENPALEVAIAEALFRQHPLLIYHGVFAQEWYASDRTMGFVLEGVSELASRLERRGLTYRLHVVSKLAADPLAGLEKLAETAALVVAEDFPCGPWPQWRQTLAQKTGVQILAVDTACVLPMNEVGRAYDRAFKFRDKTGAERERFVREKTPRLAGTPARWETPLPFDPVSPDASISEILAGMEIDHSIPRIEETPGGEGAARLRWDEFRKRHLRRYHLKRNDAADMEGVSHLSPYLHAGFIAAWDVAREALEIGGEGAEKWIDELLTWRELAWCFCRFRPDHHSIKAIPSWALDGLKSVSEDRKTRPTLAQIERGETGDALYDLCQQSLLRHGMLHNNVRMTWGKAIAGWFQDPEQGLMMALDLNHRYALDGRDPNSYGGILWCWGQFDSPKPPSPRLGIVRDRPTKDHLKRVGQQRYQELQNRSRVSGPKTVLVIGAGISGLMAARSLQDAGILVRLVDKGRGVGGRLATRRGEEGELFDHGAQYFTIRDPRVKRYLDQWLDADVVRVWAKQFPSTDQRKGQNPVDRYVGTKGMNSLAKHLAQGLDIRTSIRIETLEKHDEGWIAWSEDRQQFRADAIIVTCPVEQALDLLQASDIRPSEAMEQQLRAVAYDPCFAVMLSLDGPSGLDQPGGLFVNDGGPVVWMADHQAKGICAKPTVVLHSAGDYAKRRFDDPKDEVAKDMIESIRPRLKAQIVSHQIHRWKFSLPTVLYPDSCAVVRREPGPLVLAGDAFSGPRIEGAMLSGLAAAGRIMELGLANLSRPENTVRIYQGAVSEASFPGMV